jgi:hypothetical protein
LAEHHTTPRRRWGCGGHPTDAEPRKSPPKQIEPLGLDPQWRSSGAMLTKGGDADESQRSEGRAQ